MRTSAGLGPRSSRSPADMFSTHRSCILRGLLSLSSSLLYGAINNQIYKHICIYRAIITTNNIIIFITMMMIIICWFAALEPS